MGNLGEELEERYNLERAIAYIVKELKGEDSLLYLTGLISSVSSVEQLTALYNTLLTELEYKLEL